MSLMSQYESSFIFQNMCLAHTDIDKRMISMQVERYVMESVAGTQARSHEGVIPTTFSLTSSGTEEANKWGILVGDLVTYFIYSLMAYL